jgi:hypothetical protein
VRAFEVVDGTPGIEGALPRQPLVPDIRAYPEPPAQLPPVHALLHRKANELAPLIHYRHLSPWHGKPPEKGHSSQYGCVSHVSEHLSVICPERTLDDRAIQYSRAHMMEDAAVCWLSRFRGV